MSVSGLGANFANAESFLIDYGLADFGLADSECLTQRQNTNDITLLDSLADINHFVGWNHAKHTIDSPSAEFSKLSQEVSAYNVDSSTWRVNSKCHEYKTLNTTLVSKLSDWTRQHVNGIEATAVEPTLNFGDVAYLEIVFRLNPQGSSVLNDAELRELYPFLNSAQRQSWDNSQATLGITLFADGALNQSSRSLNAFAVVALGQANASNFSDRWQRLRIPLSDFQYYFEQDYAREATDPSSARQIKLAGLRMTAETKSGKQLRNILGKDWTPDIEENFKEIAIEMSRVALVLGESATHSE